MCYTLQAALNFIHKFHHSNVIMTVSYNLSCKGSPFVAALWLERSCIFKSLNLCFLASSNRSMKNHISFQNTMALIFKAIVVITTHSCIEMIVKNQSCLIHETFLQLRFECRNWHDRHIFGSAFQWMHLNRVMQADLHFSLKINALLYEWRPARSTH